jgi:hypothetical protein
VIPARYRRWPVKASGRVIKSGEEKENLKSPECLSLSFQESDYYVMHTYAHFPLSGCRAVGREHQRSLEARTAVGDCLTKGTCRTVSAHAACHSREFHPKHFPQSTAPSLLCHYPSVLAASVFPLFSLTLQLFRSLSPQSSCSSEAKSSPSSALFIPLPHLPCACALFVPSPSLFFFLTSAHARHLYCTCTFGKRTIYGLSLWRLHMQVPNLTWRRGCGRVTSKKMHHNFSHDKFGPQEQVPDPLP